MGLGAFLGEDGAGILGHRKEDGAVVTKLALPASDKLEKEQSADAIQPGQRGFAGTVNFVVAAIRASPPADLRRAESKHVEGR